MKKALCWIPAIPSASHFSSSSTPASLLISSSYLPVSAVEPTNNRLANFIFRFLIFFWFRFLIIKKENLLGGPCAGLIKYVLPNYLFVIMIIVFSNTFVEGKKHSLEPLVFTFAIDFE